MSAENTNAGGGETAAKIGGGYGGPVKILARFQMSDGQERFVVGFKPEGGYGECAHIFSRAQLSGVDAALSAQSTGSGGVAAEPVAGWKLVPEKATEEMLSATRSGYWHLGSQQYERLLAAAPTPPAGGGETIPDGDWLWSRLMQWCRKRGVAPAQYNDLFAIISEARSTAALRKGPTEEEIERASAAYYDGMIGKPEDQWPHHDGWTGKTEAFKGKVRAHMARALNAALLTPADRGETQAVGDGWQPISTAPKDGRDLLLWWPDLVEVSSGAWMSPARQFAEHWCKGRRWTPGFDHSHWMPLPKPPSPDQNRGEPDQAGANTEAGR